MSWRDTPDRRDISEIERMPWPRCSASHDVAMASWAASWASMRRSETVRVVVATPSLLHSASLYDRRLHLYVGVESIYVGKGSRDFTIVAPRRERVLCPWKKTRRLSGGIGRADSRKLCEATSMLYISTSLITSTTIRPCIRRTLGCRG